MQKNWSRTVIWNPKQILRPKSENELADIIRKASKNNMKVRVIGSAHSFNNILTTNDITLSLDDLQGIKELDREKNTATVYAGTKLSALNQALALEGFSLENLGDIDKQSLGGALSTGTHGTGVKLGNLPSQVISFEIINGLGETIKCSKKENSDLFFSALISLGSCGIVVTYELQLLQLYTLKSVVKKSSINDCMENFASYNRYRHFEFLCFPHTDNVQLKLADFSDEPLKKIKKTDVFIENAIDNVAFIFLNEFCRYVPKTTKFFSKICGSCFTTREIHEISHKALVFNRLIKFQEIEYAIPIQHFCSALEEIREVTNRYHTLFPIECRFVAADNIYLSPSYQRESAYIALHIYRKNPYTAFFKEAEQIFHKYEGRPHWGKWHSQSGKTLQHLYPKWEEFQLSRSSMDPHGIFLNDYLKNIFHL